MIWNSEQKLQDGKYTITKSIGCGGFGTTYLANSRDGEQVVIKTLKNLDKNDPSYIKDRQDLLNEALRLQKCVHPNIVKVYELIEEGDNLGIVMEYVPGENLASRKVFTEAEAIQYIHQISDALVVVHKNGLLHQDVKPSNIVLRQDTNEVVLIDFGIARQYSPDVTKDYTAQWSIFYAPPELYEEHTRRGPYTDIYSLAATLYTLLTGKEPESAISRYKYNCSLKEPKEINSQISENANLCILLGLELDPYYRPQSIEEWLVILDSSPGSLEIEVFLRTRHNKKLFQRLCSDLPKTVEDKYRLRAINDLAELGKDAEEVLPELMGLLNDDNEQIRSSTQSAIKAMGSAATFHLRDLLKAQKGNLQFKRNIIKVLHEMGNDAIEAVPEFLEALRDEDDEIRWYAVYAIGKFGLEIVEAVPILIDMLNDRRIGIRAYAAYALGRIGNKAEDAIPYLLERIKIESEYQEVFIACLEALDVIGFSIKEEITAKIDDKTEISGKELVNSYREEEHKKREEARRKPGIHLEFIRPMSANTPPQKNV